MDANLLGRLKQQGQLPSKIVPISFSTALPFSTSLFLKRDDLIHTTISGNKWRKLIAHLDAAPSGTRALQTLGGPYSEHLLAVAHLGAALGLATTGLVRGHDHKYLSPILAQCMALGMQLQPITRDAFANLLAEQTEPYLEGNLLHIPLGGMGQPGVLGCQAIYTEIAAEMKMPKCIVVACGSGTTAAGIAKAMAGAADQLWVICSFRPSETYRQDWATQHQVPEHQHVHFYYHEAFGRFGQTKPPVAALAQNFSVETGVMLDPVYEAKMVFGLLQLLASGAINPSLPIIMVNSGPNLAARANKS